MLKVAGGAGNGGNGTVTQINTGTGLTGGPITSNGTISLANTVVTAGSYGNASSVSTITVNAQGQITNASNTAIAIGVAAVSGAVPNTVNVIAGTNLTGGGALTGNVTINNPYNGTVTNVATGTGLTGGPITGTGTISLANTTVTAGSYGNASTVGNFTVDAQGRLTAASNTTISIPISGINNLGTNVASALANTTNSTNGIAVRDGNSNLSGNAFFAGTTSTAAANTTTTLVASSTPVNVITGSGGQTFNLPDATTLPIGAIFSFNNNQSSGSVVVKNNGGGSTIATFQSGAYGTIVLLNNSTAAGSWEVHFQLPSNVSWSTNTLAWTGSITNSTWNGVAISNTYLANSTLTLGNATLTLGSTTSSVGNLTLTNVVISSGTSTTQSAGNNSTAIATTAYVDSTATLPQIVTYTSGSGTYSCPANTKWIRVRMIGGGGGGGSVTSGSGYVTGSAGGNTTFSSSAYTAIGGSGGSQNVGGVGGTGGVGTAGIRISGAKGQNGTSTATGIVMFGGMGAASYFSGGGPGGSNASSGGAAPANSGAGGGGSGGTVTGSIDPTSGGGSGEYIEFIISNPGGNSYTYAVGAGGAGGAGATYTGGNGGSGIVSIEEHYRP